MKTLSLITLILSAVLYSNSSFAQIPTGSFTGFASNNAFQEWCSLNHADVRFNSQANGVIQIYWNESGFANNGGYGGFCDHSFDATLTPSGHDNQWDVNFVNNSNMIFGTATFVGNVLKIQGNYSGLSPYQAFNATFTFSADQKSVRYNRRIDVWSGPTLFASGTLYTN